ncbi:carbohydrate sulfotransferase 10-like [Penaeus indicus]|uniref:carbohydrate sulfotransferase 10-like n=1 Tax=Penaeus indicus TaxID=29960 RepID=UPI00300C5528
MAKLRWRPRFFLLVGVVLLAAWAFVEEASRVPDTLKHTDLFDAWLLQNRNNISRYEIKKLGLDADSETYQRWLVFKLLDSLGEGNVTGRIRDSQILQEYMQYQKWLSQRPEGTGHAPGALAEGDRTVEGEQDDWQDPLADDGEDVEYEDDDNEEESIELRLQKRRNSMLTSCAAEEQNWAMEDLARVWPRFGFFFDQKTSVCAVGKAGSSSWREHIHRVNGIPQNVQIQDDPRVKEFFEQPKEALYATIISSAKIISVRHPLTRLVSCYRSKFNFGRPMKRYEPKKEASFLAHHNGLDWPTRFYTYWLPALHTNGLIPEDTHLRLNLSEPINPTVKYNLTVYEGLYRLLKPHVLFSHFLTHVVHTHKTGTWNGHWGKYTELCAPCGVKYDYIIKLETMSEDLEYVFQKLGIPSNPHLRKNKSTRRKDFSKYFRYYRWISKELKREVFETFKDDLAMFEYTLPKNFL